VNKFEKIIQEEIKLFDTKFKQTLSSKASLLYKITKHVSRSSGKKIRPICTILSSGLSVNISEKTYRSAILIELLHTATLIHDDIVDDAQLRRGALSLNAVWKNKISVLTGDYFLAKGLQLAVVNKDYDVLNLISEVVQKIVEGELLQIEKTKKLNLTEEDYFKIINLKTASLFQCSFKAGAIAAEASVSITDNLSELGLIIGNIFQIKDDILDYDISNKSGKQLGNDIAEGKINLPLLYAIKKMSLVEKNQVYRFLRKKTNSHEEITFVQNKVLKYQGIQEAEEIMEKNYRKALSILNNFPSNNYQKAIKLLLSFLIERKR
tara:strand:+ start:293 stop:1258 length:966 start_codon:yes stop_codon:yes gene_type:complete